MKDINDLLANINNNGFEEDIFLEYLIFNENIANVAENPVEYFKKLIKLYGEEELANYSRTVPIYKENDPHKIYKDYEEYEEPYEDDFKEQEDGDDEISWGGNTTTIEQINYDFEENATNDDKTLKIYAPHTLHDFITGKEDELIGVASTKTLKKALLVSKLRTVDETNYDISDAIREYADEIYKDRKDYCYTDEYGLPDVKTTFLNLADLPILDDKNFYMYLVKNTDETQLPIDKLVAYIDSEIVNEQLINDLRKTRETKKYEYQNEETNYKSEETIDDKLLAWLEGKEKTLTSLEQEEKKISEAEQLIDIQKDGQNRGE